MRTEILRTSFALFPSFVPFRLRAQRNFLISTAEVARIVLRTTNRESLITDFKRFDTISCALSGQASNGENCNILDNFEVDGKLMGLFKNCVDDYGCRTEPNAEWGNNILSTKLIVYGDGMISKSNVAPPPTHRVSVKELELCKTISAQLAARCTQEIGMGSAGSGHFGAFYIAAQLPETGDPVIPTQITEEMIRAKFADTIFPLATIKVEPLRADGDWWKQVREDGAESGEEYLEPWHDMIKAFEEHPELNSSVFVQIGDSDHLLEIDEAEFPAGTEMPGLVLPRMALGLTAGGSIVGLFADVSHA